MLKNHLLILFRNLNKNRLFFFINILGLSIAIGCCVVAYFLYDFNASFDDNHANAASIYRVNSIREYQGKATTYTVVPLPLGETVRENIKEIEKLSRFSESKMNMVVGSETFRSRSVYVDADFFTMFTFEFIHGSAKALTSKNKVVISDQMAVKYFGTDNVVNKVLTQLMGDSVKRDFEIVGVYKVPKANSSFEDEDLFALYDGYWDESAELNGGENWKMRSVLFVQVNNASRIPSIESELNKYVENNNKVREDFLIKEFKLDNLQGMAARDMAKNTGPYITRRAAPLSAVFGTALMGILVLLIACFNLTNTAIALSQRRLKEIGIRKVMGGVRYQLILQYVSETLVICFIALIVGLILAESFILPAFNQLWSFMKLDPDYFGKPGFLIFITGILFFTGLLAGSYPAFHVSKFQPTAILKGKLQFGGNNFVTYFLLSTQLILSLTGIVCGFAFIGNAQFQKDFDLGFDKDAVICADVKNRSEYEIFRNALAGNQDIISITGSPNHIHENYYNDPVNYEGHEIETNILDVGDDYLKTVGVTLIEGRDFVKDSETDRRESVLVTEEFVRQFGWEKAIGKKIAWMDTSKFYVVGVVKNICSLWEPMTPWMIRYAKPDRVNYIIVKANVNSTKEVNAFMETKWKETFPNRVYSPRLMNSGVSEANMVNNNILKMFLFQGALALLLSVTGLYTLVSLNVIKRMKEIGVRKLLGATIVNIIRIINTEFIVIVIIACVAGAYAGSFVSEVLMRSIWDFHQEPTIMTLLISCFVLVSACILSVAVKTYNTANMNPVDVLKDE